MIENMDNIAEKSIASKSVAKESSLVEMPSIVAAKISGYKLILSCSCCLDLNVQPGADDFRVFDGETELAIQSAYIEHPIIIQHSQIVIALDHLFVGEAVLRIRYQPEESALLMAESNLHMADFDHTVLVNADIGHSTSVADADTENGKASSGDSAQTESIEVPVLTDIVDIYNFEKVRVTSHALNKQRLILMFDKKINPEYQPLANDFYISQANKRLGIQSVFIAKQTPDTAPVLVIMLTETPKLGINLEVKYNAAAHSLRCKASALSLSNFCANITIKDSTTDHKPLRYTAMLKTTAQKPKTSTANLLGTNSLENSVKQPHTLLFPTTNLATWVLRGTVAAIAISGLYWLYSTLQ